MVADSCTSIIRTDRPGAAGRFIEWLAEFSPRGLRRLAIQDSECQRRPAADAARDGRVRALRAKLAARMNGEDAGMRWNEFDLRGHPDFHLRVWKAMHALPFGTVATYGEVADEAGSPLAFRACGQACGTNPVILFIPCHRVVASSGLGGFGCGLEWKKLFLRLEGVEKYEVRKTKCEVNA